MVEKVFGTDFTNETNPSGSATVSVNTGSALVDVTLNDILKIIASLTGDTTPASGDSILTWDVSASAVKQVLIGNLYKALVQLPVSGMTNGVLSVVVSSNDLVVSVKTLSGTDPSSTDVVYVNINGVIRTITSALSITLADGVNWFNAGGADLATKEIDYFAYCVWDSNSSAVALGVARVPYGNVVSDFSSTPSDERYLGGYSGFTSTDNVCVVGRFAATLSAGASYIWTVPTFNGNNLIQRPIFFTRWLSYSPTRTNVTPGTGSTAVDYYQIDGFNIEHHNSLVLGTGGSLSGALGISQAMSPASILPAFANVGWALYRNAAGSRLSGSLLMNGGSLIINSSLASGTYVTDTSVTATVPFTWTVGDRYVLRYRYPIG